MHAVAAAATLAALFVLCGSTASAQTLNLVTTIPSASFVGEPFCYTDTLTNTGPTGYGPYIRLVVPVGMTFTSASFLGIGATILDVGVFPVAGTLTDPWAALTVAGPTGEHLYLIAPPIGSLVTGQPPVVLDICMAIFTSAVVGTPLNVKTTPIYRYGNTPTGVNGPLVFATRTDPVTPTVVKFSKKNNAPEGERPPTAGTAFPVTFTLTADIANTKTLTNLVFTDTLPANLQFTPGSILVNGAACGAGCTINQQPSGATPGGTVQVTVTSATGTVSAADATVSYVAYVPAGVLNPVICQTQTVTNSTSLACQYLLVAQPVLNATSSLTAKHVALQKGASASPAVPGGTVTYTLNFQVSDFVTASGLVITDTLPDGVTFASMSSATVGGSPVAIVPGVAHDGTTGITVVTFGIGSVTGPIAGPSTGQVVYTATIDTTYEGPPLTGQPVRQNDTLANSVRGDYTLVGGAPCSDTSASSVTITPVSIAKSIVSPKPEYVPGDVITFRLRMDIPSGDVQAISFEDFLPLPVFVATTIPTSFPSSPGVRFGPNNTLPGTVPTVTTNGATNSILFVFPDISTASAQVLEVEFDVTVTNTPFADQLFLTNLFQAKANNSVLQLSTNLTPISIHVRAPQLVFTKGVFSTDNAAAVIAPLPSVLPVNGNVTGIDAGDTVTFRMTVENTGGAPAANVTISDPTPAGFSGCSLVTASDGTGAALATTGSLAAGLVLTNPLAANDNTPPGGGAPYGTDTALVTVACTVTATVNPLQTLTNTGSATWTSLGGSTAFAAVSDSATATVAPPTLVKAGGGVSLPIGGTTSYTVTVTVPEGVTPNLTLVDTLPAGLAFVSQTGAAVSGGVAVGGGTTPVVTNNGQTVTWNLGTVTNSNSSNGTPETITLTYTVVVLNVAGNTRGVTLRNSVAGSYTGGSLATVQAPAVTVIEPTLSATKTRPTPGGNADANDLVSYQIVLRHTAPSNADAFDVTFSDPLPKVAGGSLIVNDTTPGTPPAFTVVDSLGPVTAADFEMVGDDTNGWTLQTKAAGTGFNFPQSAVRTITITISGRLAGAALLTPNQSIVNAATLRWTSLSGNPGQISTLNANSTERTGAGGVNTYSSVSSNTLTVFPPAPAKTIAATSEAGTAETTPRPGAIGEVVRYRLVSRMAEATAINLQVVDQIPAGLQYLNDGTTKLAFVCNGGASCMTSTTLSDPALVVSGNETTVAAVTPSFVLPGAAITGGPFGTGTDPTFSFGTVVNNDSDADQEFLVLEFNALVLNVGGNVSGTNLDNTFTVRVNGAQIGAASASVRVTVFQPNVTVTKSGSRATGAGGDTVTYTVTLTNGSGANVSPAYDATVTDTLPALLQLSLPVTVTLVGGASGLTDSSAGQTVSISVATIPPGGSATITYTATIQPGGSPGQPLVNTAATAWTSLPGANGTTPNPTGSTTPGASGTGTGERLYMASPTWTVTINSPILAKSVLGTSESSTAGNSVAIGEKVQYLVTVRVPEGTTSTNVVLSDALPAGLAIVSLDALDQVDGSGNPIVSLTFAPNTLAQVLFNAQAALASPGQTLAFTLGTVTNTNLNTTTGEFVRATYTAVVLNVAGNARGTSLTNTVSFARNGASTITVSAPALTVVEPRLTVAKAASPASAYAGDVVTYTLTVSNPAAANGADAFDVALSDAVPAGLTLVPGTLQNLSGPAATLSEAGPLTAAWTTFAQGATSVLRFQAAVNANVTAGQSITNTATATWTSLPGSPGQISTFNASSTERSGTGVNAYTASGSATETVNPRADLKVAKTAAPTAVAAGDTIAYTLVASNLGPSDATGAALTDPLSSGTGFVSLAAAAGWTCTTPAVGATGTVSCTRAALFAAGAADTFTLVVQVPSGTLAGTLLGNTASITSTTADPDSSNNVSSVTTPVAAAADADLAVTKTATPAAVVTGANVTYAVAVTNNGPGTATNAVLADLVPSGAAFVSVTPPAGWSCTTPDVTCTNPSVTAGASDVFTIVLQATGAAGSTITNTVTVSSATNDPVPSNNSATAKTGIVGAPTDADVAVTKTGPAGPVAPGSVVTYTLTVMNNGPATATSVSVADPAPAGLSFVANSGACTTTFPCVLGTLAPGASQTITTQFLVSSPFTGSSPYTNTAAVTTATNDPVVSNNTSSASTTVATAPTDADLAIAKSDSPDPVYAGSNVRYTIVVTNNGPGTATGASVTDVLPVGTSFVSATPSQGSCSGTSTVTCALGNVAPGETATLTLFVKTSAAGTISNTATVTSTSNDPVPGNNSSTTPTTVIAPDLTIAKVHAPSPFVRGSTGVYTLTVSSLAGATAAPTFGTVTVTDTLPAGLTPTSAGGAPDWSCGIAAQTVTCTTSNILAPGASYAAISVDVAILESAPAPVSNTATVTGGGDVTPGNDSATDVAPVISTADLSITKTDGVATAIPGTTTTYTITVSNAGPSLVTNAPVADTLPGAIASATWTCAASIGSSCGAASGSGNIATAVSLLSGGTAAYTVIANVGPAALGLLVNTATVSTPAGVTDPNSGNDASTDTDTLTPQADLSVVKTGSPTLMPGQNATYTFTVANAGPSNATSVSLADTLPPNTTFVSLSSPGGWSCTTPAVGAAGSITCPEPVFAAGAPAAVFTLVVRVDPSVATGTVVTNTAAVTSSTTDPNPLNNSSSTTGTASASAELSMAKTGPATAVPGGPNVVFTTVVTNNGPSDAQAVSVADPTPAGLTFISNAGACTTVFPCNLGTVPAGATPTITSTYQVPSGYPAPAPIVNVTTVSSTTPDPTPGNNSSTATVLVPTGIADIAVTKTVDNSAPSVGSNVTFTITASDLGPSDASGVAITDILPSGLTFVSATPSQGTYSAATGVWTIGGIAVGALPSLQIVATVTQAGTIVNTATKTAGDQTDPNPSNNSGSAVVNGPASVADIQVQKTVDNAIPAVGANVTFAVRVLNAGPSGATGVSVTDVLPPGLTFVSATPTAGTSYTSGTGVWTIGSMPNGASVTLALVANVPAAGTFVNTATKSAENELDPNTSNDSAVAGVVAGGGGTPQADLGLQKTDSPDPVRAGQNLSYTLVVTNRGPNDATGVTLTDPLPAGVSYVSASASQGGCGGTSTVTCLLGALPAGNSATVSVVVTALASAVPSITNTAVVSATETDPNPADNSSTAVTTVTPVADVAIAKTVSNPTPLVTQGFTFTVTATNNGPSAANGVVVTDVLPVNLGFVSATPSQGTHVIGTGLWTVGTLANGASATLTLAVTALSPGAFTNTATKTAETELDTNPANDSGTAGGGVGIVADLTIVKTHAPATFLRGASDAFSLMVSNIGTGPTSSLVTVSDVLPAGLIPTAASGAGWVCTVTAPSISCTRSDALAVSAPWPAISITASVTLAAPASVSNTATVSGGGDITPGNDSSTDVVPIASQADLAITKTGPVNAVPGNNIVYTLVVTNNGPSDAAAVSVTDPTPANLTFVSNAGACTTPFPCDLGSVPVGATRSITATFLVPAGYSAPSPIVNSASVSSSTADPNLVNNGSSVSTSVAADVSVMKSIASATPVKGQPITYGIVVTNRGPSTATGVTLTDPLPSQVSVLSVTTTQGSCSGSSTVTCALGTLLNGASATVYITVAPATSGASMRNTATVSANEFDPDGSNNTSTADLSFLDSVPTLSEWALGALSLALALAGARALRRDA